MPPPDSAPTAHAAAPPPDSAIERTRLSWRRTTLVATVVAILLVRLALRDREGIGVLGVAALCWVGLLVVVQQRVNSLRRPPGRAIVLTAAACLAFGVLGVVLVAR